MRFILFTNAGASLDAHRVGVQSADGKTVTDLTAALSDAGLAITSMRKFLELGPKGREIADAAVANAIYTRPAELTTLRAPIYDRRVHQVYQWKFAASVAPSVHYRTQSLRHY